MTKEQALPGIPILASGERITADIVNYIQYAKEKGCSLTGPQDSDRAAGYGNCEIECGEEVGALGMFAW